MAREHADAGDVSWRQWVEEFDRGEATLIDMRVSVEVELDGGAIELVEAVDQQVWVNLAQHPPVVAALVAELAGKDFGLLAGQVQELGGQLTEDDLTEMYVSVDLDTDLLDALRPSVATAREPGYAARPGSETEPTLPREGADESPTSH